MGARPVSGPQSLRAYSRIISYRSAAPLVTITSAASYPTVEIKPRNQLNAEVTRIAAVCRNSEKTMHIGRKIFLRSARSE